MDNSRPSLPIGIEPIKKFLDAKRRGVELRYLTEITEQNISSCKMLMEIVDELRHMDGLKGNLMVNEKEYLAQPGEILRGQLHPGYCHILL